MEFRILGPLEVIGPDGPVVLRGTKRRGLLAFLLVQRGQVVASDRLVEALAEGDSNSGGAGTIQTYLSQLRKLLPPVGGGLVTHPSGYVFDIPDDALDAARFESMLRAASAEPDAGTRLRLLDGALALWRGPALEEFSWPWADTERARLERRHLDALSLRAETRLDRGEHLEALSELDSLTEEYPLDERLCGQRMLAAYRSGRQAEALRAYQQLRHDLAHELGIEPSPDLVELERRMLDHDATLRAGVSTRAQVSLDADADAARGTGEGYGDSLHAIRSDSRLTLGLATVAVLITDLVGSASLRTQLGDHRADEIERWHEGVLSKAVTDYQGTIVKRLGDGVMAVFTTATDAVAAAASMQTRIARESPTKLASLEVRIGVSAGEVVVEAGDVRGLPPTEAARLCARAKGGQILVSQLVHDLAVARSAATFQPAGVFEPKGLPGPVPIYEVPWPVGSASAVPIPDTLVGNRDFAFVGRARELDVLASVWKDACDASGFRAAIVTGEAGAGKSRLTAEFARVVDGDGHTILHGRCDEVAGYPYQPVAEWLRHYLAHASSADVGMVRARHGGELSRLVPELVSAHASGPSNQADNIDPFPLYDAVLGWLTFVADSGPVLLVLDDLQWASQPTLAVVQHLLAAAPRFPGVLIATCRDDIPERDLARVLGRVDVTRDSVRRVELGGIESVDVVAMISESSRSSTVEYPLPELAREIYEESGGNPLFVTSLAEQLGSDDLRRLRASHQPVRPPARVMELVVDRLARIDPATVDLLQKAAVTGTEFEFTLLRTVAGEPDDDRLLETLAAAVSARYLVELPGTPLRYRFPHGVVRNALLETVPTSVRMRLHKLAGHGLEQLGRAADDRTVALLAYHFSQAAPLGEVERALEYCRLAADVASQQLAHEEAVAWYERALDVADDVGVSDDVRYELLLSLGRAQVCAGDKRSRDSLFNAYRIAAAASDATSTAEAMLSLNRGFFSRTGETDVEAVEALEATLALFDGEDDSGIKASLLAALASELVWAEDGDRRFALSDEALAMARRVADPSALARVLGLRNMTILAPDTLHERTANCYELLGLAEEVQDDLVRFDAAFHRGGTALEAGDADAANDMVEVAARVADRLRQPRLLWRARLMQTAQAVFRGALDDAEFFATEALELGRRAGQGSEAFLFHTEQLLEIRRWQGRLDEHLAQLKPFAGQPNWDFGFAITRYLYEAGDVDAALVIYRNAVAGEFLPLRRDMLVAPSLYNLSFLASRDRDATTAVGLYDALLPIADSFANTTIAKPSGWHFLGILAATMGKVDTAESCMQKAITAHEVLGAPLFRAESEIELARILFDDGRDAERVTDLVERAHATAVARAGRNSSSERAIA